MKGMLTKETNKLQLTGKDVIQLCAEPADLDASYDKIEQVDIPSTEALPCEFQEPFVTVHLGADGLVNGNHNTKLWYADRLQEIVYQLKREKRFKFSSLDLKGNPTSTGPSTT